MSRIEFDRRGETVLGRPVIFCRLKQPVAGFIYAGRVDGGFLDMWTEDGRWREDGVAHPLDLALTREVVS